MHKKERALVLLLALALLFCVANRGFWGNHGESRRSEVGREVAVDGNWLVPTLLGEPFVTKPPLNYWLIASSFKVTGVVDDWSARLPAVCSAVASTLLVMGMARRWKNPQTGELYCDPGQTGAIFATMPMVFLMAQNAETEPLLLFFSTLTVYSHMRIDPAKNEWFWRVMFAASLALGFMVKGPLGWIFPLLGVLSIELTSPKGGRKLKLGDLGLFLAAHAILAAPWFLYVLKNVPSASKVWFGETVARVGDPDFTTHREPRWYYVPQMLGFGLFVFLLPKALAGFVAKRPKNSNWPLAWFLLGVLVLSLGTSKRAHYMLSMSPGLALALGAEWARLSRFGFGRFLGAGLKFVGWSLPGLLIGAWVWMGKEGTLDFGFGFFAALIVLVVIAIMLFAYKNGDPVKVFAGSFLVTVIAGSLTVLPAVDEYRSPRAFLEKAKAIAGPDAQFANWSMDAYSSSFYLGRNVKIINDGAMIGSVLPNGGWLIGEGREVPPASVEVMLHESRDPFKASKKHRLALYRFEAPKQ